MSPLTAVKIHITVFDELSAGSCYASYTLPNTPFYFKTVWYDQNLKTNYSQYRILWEFGDGTYVVGPSASHFYSYPGTYDVKVTLYDASGTTLEVVSSTDSGPLTVSASNAFPDKLVFQPFLRPEEDSVYLLPAGQLSKPLDIERYNSWQNDEYLAKNNYSIVLYASGCRSDFLSVSSYYTDKWSHLRSYFGFVESELKPSGEVNTKIVESTRTSSVSVFATKQRSNDWSISLNFTPYKTDNSAFVGTSGTATTNSKTVHFVDQKPSGLRNQDLIFLYASFDTKAFADYFNIINSVYANVQLPAYGYINFKPEVQFLKSVFNPAQTLAITSNGITAEGTVQTIGPVTGEYVHSFNINPIKWANTEIPFVITFKDSKNYTTKSYPPISGFNRHNLALKDVNLYLCKVTELDPLGNSPVSISAHRLLEAEFKLNNEAPIYTNSGSYFCGTVKLPYESEINFLSAAAAIKDDPAYSLGFNYGFAGQPGIKSISRFKKRAVFSSCQQSEISFSITGESTTYTVSPSSTISISVSPLKTFGSASDDKVWITDSDADKIHIYSSFGRLLQGLSLSAMLVGGTDITPPTQQDLRGDLESASPSNIAIDSQGYAWVTLYDAINTIKINPDTYVVVASAVPPLANTQYIASTTYSLLSGFAGENSLLPSCVDTDTRDNIWVSYSHPVSAFLMKYDSKGNHLKTVYLEPFVSIQEIVIDKSDNVWAGAIDYKNGGANPYTREDKLYKFDSDGNLITGFPKTILGLNNITIDLDQNILVSSGYAKITKFTPAGNSSTFTVGTQAEIYDNHSIIGGVATDAEGYLWVVQNVDGKMFFVDLNSTTALATSAIPSVDLPGIELLLSNGYQSFYEVLGDWTAIRWINKYYRPGIQIERVIEGKSNLFAIYNKGPALIKKNEDFDQAATFKSYVLQESLFDKQELFDNFLGQIVGNADSEPETLGKTIYEKIANFTSNTSDPDTCNIAALRSLFEQYGLDFNYFVSSYPSRLRRAVDLLSINNTKLFGSSNLYSTNFGLSAYGYLLGKNLGKKIPIDTGKFIAGEPVVAYEKFSEKYTKIINTIVPETDGCVPTAGEPYSLSGINYNWGWNLVTAQHSQSGVDLDPYYIFYEYQPYTPNNKVDGVIDFTNELTTINPRSSGYGEWIKFGGTMDRVLSRAFYEGLQMIK